MLEEVTYQKGQKRLYIYIEMLEEVTYQKGRRRLYICIEMSKELTHQKGRRGIEDVEKGYMHKQCFNLFYF